MLHLTYAVWQSKVQKTPVKSKKMTSVASLVSVYHLRARVGVSIHWSVWLVYLYTV